MIVEHYIPQSKQKIYKAIIYAGSSDNNIKIIKLNTIYHNPKFYPRKFINWPDEFEIQIIDDKSIKIRRTDVSIGGWGENLIIDVEYDELNVENNYMLSQKIPRIIYQTFETYDVPIGMYKSIQSWKNLNNEYEYYFYNNDDRIKFIGTYFDKSVLDAYLTLIPGAFRADLWRCCILYLKGGIYVDSDMICVKPFREYIDNELEFIASRDDPMSKTFVCNGFIGCSPNHPFMKEQISAIVNNIKLKQKGYYLDLTGPALLGKSIKKICNMDLDKDFELGDNNINNYKFRLLFHDWKTKTIKLNEEAILITEYEGKLKDMELIKNPTYYSLYQQDMIYQIIPRKIYYTTKDWFDINNYMIESYKNKNKYWDLNYYDDIKCLNFIKNNNYIFLEELGVDVLKYYLTLINGGEKSDLWRYCIIYLMGGVYVDADTYCNIPLDEWIKHHDLIVGIEANVDIDIARQFGMDKIGLCIDNKVISVCNWAFAAYPKHIVLKNIIIDICSNHIFHDVLNNTGPGRFTKHVLNYFSNCDLSLLNTDNIIKGKSILYNINKFGSNQSHSNSYKNYLNPFICTINDIYIVHMFEGSWRYSYNNKEIKLYKSSFGISHNLTILKTDTGFSGISRLDKDTSRTIFMKNIGDCKSLLEFTYDNDFNIISENERQITNYNNIAKFEDYRYFIYNNDIYLAVSYIDTDFNTKVSILNKTYKYLGDVIIDTYNKVSFCGNEKKIWEKNWLFFEKNGVLYFIYSTMPRYILYKCINFTDLQFVKYIDIEWPLKENVPKQEVYFTSYIGSDIKIATGGSTNPIFIKSKGIYMYLIHTKINQEFKYNHYVVILNENLIPIKLCENPIINKSIEYNLFFIMSMIETEHYLIISGGISDNSNFVWELSKEKLFKKIGI